jgi:DNA-binding transcriptional ArsR family regulator
MDAMSRNRRAAGSEPERFPEAESYTIRNLEQVKVLADPLRIRILEALCRERTTKQVAELLGEKPTKLYHHVDALERVGLIRLARTRQNRGTLEKYYLAVARSFRADSSLFREAGTGGPEADALRTMVSTVLENTTHELTELIAAGDAERALKQEGLLSYVEILTTDEEIERLRADLAALLGRLQECSEPPPDEGRRYRLTLAFYPLDAGKDT